MLALVLFGILFFLVTVGIILFIFGLLLPALGGSMNHRHILFSKVESGQFMLSGGESQFDEE